VLLYYITDRRQFPGTPVQQRDRLLEKIADAARAGVDLIQLRERDLSARELYQLATEALCAVRETRNVKRETKLLINSRIDVALACGADGVHLRADDFSASDARAIWAKSAREVALAPLPDFLFGVSCHNHADILSAEAHGADFVVYAPVFEKQGTSSQAVGLDGLRKACGRAGGHDKKVEAGFASGMPILALGGITLANARECVAAGAAGIAAIRLFQEHDVAKIVEAIRG
jgi:thiamine-phosphate pyrophosphorylase